MAYTRKYSSKRKGRSRKTSWYNRKFSALDIAKKALSNTRYLKGLVNSEMFHIQNTQTGIAISNTGGLAHLTNIAQTDTDSGRTGNSILLRNLLFRVSITQHASASTTFCRFMLIQDTQQIADTVPSISDVLETVHYLSPLKDGSVGRFKVMLNKVVSLDSASKKCYVNEFYKKLYLHVRYNGSNNTDQQKNAIYLILLSSETTNTPTFAYETKLGYHDN